PRLAPPLRPLLRPVAGAREPRDRPPLRARRERRARLLPGAARSARHGRRRRVPSRRRRGRRPGARRGARLRGRDAPPGTRREPPRPPLPRLRRRGVGPPHRDGQPAGADRDPRRPRRRRQDDARRDGLPALRADPHPGLERVPRRAEAAAPDPTHLAEDPPRLHGLVHIMADKWLRYFVHVRPRLVRGEVVVLDRYFYDLRTYAHPLVRKPWLESLIMHCIPEPAAAFC